ncbi:MAG: cell division protein FtsX [Pseudomonadota bacterium]
MSRDRSGPTPLLPVEDAREAALFFVVGALCFLAALAALSGKATYGAAQAWTSQVEGELTIRLKDVDARAAAEAIDIISATEGLRSARLMDRDEVAELLEPWFGAGGLPAGLPLPTFIAATSEAGANDVGPNVQRRLTERGFSADVDAHADWADDVRRMLSALRFAAICAVALLAATAVAVIAFATHAALLARRDIVDVLHLSGAEDRFIASLFERRFWLLGLRAGAVGALAALGAAALVSLALSRSGGRTGLLPNIQLDATDVLILVVTPIAAGFAARIAARLTVLRGLAATV